MRSGLLSAAALLALAQSQDDPQVFLSSKDGRRLSPFIWTYQDPAEINDVELVLDPDSRFQTMMGYGAAFTEATAVNFRRLSAEDQNTVLEMYFGETGHGFNLGRVPIGSCDFSKASYNFDSTDGDFSMSHFDRQLSHDVDNGMVDMMLRASAKAASLELFGSPWSPPPWLKNGDHAMVGSLNPCLKADPSHHAAWAKYLSTWISAYEAKGLKMIGITAQNEPGFWDNKQWEACSFTPETQRDFIRDHLGPQLTRDFGALKKKIMIYDWNKDQAEVWANVTLSDAQAAQYVWGVGLHWYTGDFFDKVANINEQYPEKPMLATEGCNCATDVGTYPTEWARAVRYAHDMIGDFNNGVIGWVDWNLLLDISSDTGAGGPNHAGNLCFAQIHVDQAGKLNVTAAFYAFGHFSRFAPAGSTRLGWSIESKGQAAVSNVEVFSVQRPDGKFAAVLMNNGDMDLTVGLSTSTQVSTARKVGIVLPAWSIATAVFPQQTQPKPPTSFPAINV